MGRPFVFRRSCRVGRLGEDLDLFGQPGQRRFRFRQATFLLKDHVVELLDGALLMRRKLFEFGDSAGQCFQFFPRWMFHAIHQ